MQPRADLADIGEGALGLPRPLGHVDDLAAKEFDQAVDRLRVAGPDIEALFAQTANYVDRILKGAQAGDLPIERPARFDMVINMKTAKALGLTIPQSLLLRADRVID